MIWRIWVCGVWWVGKGKNAMFTGGKKFKRNLTHTGTKNPTIAPRRFVGTSSHSISGGVLVTSSEAAKQPVCGGSPSFSNTRRRMDHGKKKRRASSSFSLPLAKNKNKVRRVAWALPDVCLRR